jgi:xanthine/uracil permease
MIEFNGNDSVSRGSEWFVPKVGPPKLRAMVGLLFLPYTGMVLSFTVMGAMLSPHIHWDRVAAMAVIYFLGLGISAHGLDALGSRRRKPWGDFFGKRELWFISILSLAISYLIAIPYMIFHVPLLWAIAVLEGFFVFAYNLEWFRGKFHTDNWFSFSWGFLPVLAGYIMQTNRLSSASLLVAISAGLLSRVEIKASRPYKALQWKQPELTDEEISATVQYEAILKSVSLGVILLALGLLIQRI